MRILLRLAVSAALLAAVCPTAEADDDAVVLIQPRISVGQQEYQLEFDDVLSPSGSSGFDFRDGFRVDDQLPFAGAGVTVTMNRWFLDVSGQRSQRGHEETYQFSGRALGNDVFAPGDGHPHHLGIDLDREEFNATLGYGFTDAFSVYVGYKDATVNMSQRQSPEPRPDPGDILFIGDYAMDFSYRGCFIGATYVIPVGAAGALSLQSSLARLDGSFSQRFSGDVLLAAPTAANQFAGVPIDKGFRDGVVDGDSLGVNVGVSWTGTLGWIDPALSRLTYTVGIDRSQYEFDSSGSKAFWAADFQEKHTRVRLDLRYRLGADD